MRRASLLACAFSLLFFVSAKAEIVYRPINPSFGGNPLNSNHLQGLANAQKLFEETEDARSSQSPSERFLSMLQSRLYSSLASQVSEAIFGENAQPQGTIVFDDQQVSFVNTGTEIQITVTNFSTGQVTNIVVPTMQN
jgi:curli production assembly/transport component CsgF